MLTFRQKQRLQGTVGKGEKRLIRDGSQTTIVGQVQSGQMTHGRKTCEQHPSKDLQSTGDVAVHLLVYNIGQEM